MDNYLFFYPAQVKQYITKIIVSIGIVFFVFIFFLYHHYEDKVRQERNQALQDNYSKIVEVTVQKINFLLAKFSQNLQSSGLKITNDNTQIELCINNRCIKYSILQLGSLINQNIPEYIRYRLQLNRNFLYSNGKEGSFYLEKVYYLNQETQLNLIVSMDDIFWQKRAKEYKAEAEDLAVYFDQAGEITSRMGINAVPAIAYQEGKKIKIEQIKLEEA